MTCAKSVFLVGITLIYTINIVGGTPWLYKHHNTSSLFSFGSSASDSSSVSSTTESHIADLRKKIEKSSQLQQDKEIVQQEDLADDDDEESSGDDENIEVNEASPSFIRKKVSKILAKLRLIAQIKNAYHASKEQSKHNRNFTFSKPSRNSTDHQIKSAEDTEEFDVESIAPQSQNIQQIYKYSAPNERLILPSEKIDEPTKVALEVNEINDKVQTIDKADTDKAPEPEPSRFGPLGVFFAELFGTIVGLTYGAVTQLTSGNQSPVVESTSPASR